VCDVCAFVCVFANVLDNLPALPSTVQAIQEVTFLFISFSAQFYSDIP